MSIPPVPDRGAESRLRKVPKVEHHATLQDPAVWGDGEKACQEPLEDDLLLKTLG
jgi:hypothetical protein